MALPMKKAAAMKAMKVMKAMKAKKTTMKVMKAMKAKKVSVIARGKMARAAVFRGSKQKTQGGMTKDKLVKNRHGKIVSKAASVRAKKAFANSGLKAWADAVKKARKALNLTGFVAIGGKSATGKALYAKAKALLSQ
uniref:Uncharacterized protein n=1 Tax=Phaeocystis antarctica TaxID=33657 RepID=A0A7S0ER18_9EUKA